MKVNIGFPVVRTDGWSVGRSVYGHMINKFSGMGRLFTKLWGSASSAITGQCIDLREVTTDYTDTL